VPGSQPSREPLAGPTVREPDPPPTGTARGYSIVIPPEWRKIPVRHGADKAITEIVAEVFRSLPRDAPPDRVGPYRKQLHTQLTGMVREAREKGGLDLYLPVLPMHGAPVGASFIVSELSLGTADPAMVVAHLVAEDDAVLPVTVDEAVGLRIERAAGPAPGEGIEAGSRRVDYVLKVPGDPERWLVIAFSTLGGGDPDDDIARLLTGLFDAMMSTFRWQREP